MRISTNQIFDRGINSLIDRQAVLSRLQQQMSTGKKILQAADDPVGAARILLIKQEASAIVQYGRNLNTAEANLGLEESVLKNINDVLARIRELAIAAGSAVNDTQTRGYIAEEIEARRDELIDLANSRGTNGEYLFSGFSGRNPTVSVNASGQYVYGGDEGQRNVAIGNGISVFTNDTGQEVFFKLASGDILSTINSGLANTTIATTGLQSVVPGPAFSGLSANNLILNGELIEPTTGDGVSDILASASAIAIASAINASSDVHGVTAQVSSNVVNLGVAVPAAMAAGAFTINGQNIISVLGTEQDIIDKINNASDNTGVVATQPGGTGTNILLTAADGRNIHIQTGVGFGVFGIGASANQAQRAALTLSDHAGFSIAGSNPAIIGLTAGDVAVTGNAGTAAATVKIIGVPPEPITETYSIRFSDATTYSIYQDSNPATPLSDFTNLTYTEEDNIDFLGMRVNITGTPATGDRFTVALNQEVQEDIFTGISDLLSELRSNGQETSIIAYRVGIGLKNIDEATTKVLQVRAKIGARLNIVESQKDVLARSNILLTQQLSSIEELDFTKAVSDLAQQTFLLEAAQQGFIRIQGLTLFNYLR